MALALLVPASAGAADAGPVLREPAGALARALSCSGDLAGGGAPVLLVHGTGVTASQNWSWGYQPQLARRGHGTCTVDLPDRGFGDVQRSIEYVVAAIREVHRRAGRPIAVVGHSQGAILPPVALRIWPDLAPMVDDVVGLAGTYRGGVEDPCGAGRGCPPSFAQLDARAAWWPAVLRHPLPTEPSYTAIGTLRDEIVRPQPQVNRLPPGPRRRSVEIQDLCPGRETPRGLNHLFPAADAVSFALTLDALDHPGPADPTRIPATVCSQLLLDGADPVGLLTGVLPALAAPRPGAAAEPALRCYLVPSCGFVDAVEATPSARLRQPRRRGRLALRVALRAADAGQVRITGSGPRGTVDLLPTTAIGEGRRTAAVALPRLPRPKHRRSLVRRYRVRVLARHLAADPWRDAGGWTLRIRVRR